MSERWERVTSLFGAARALDPRLRDSFLKIACEGDDNLRSEVEALLSRDTADDGFLEDAPWAGLGKALVERSLAAGQVLKGRYRIEAELATGGQARVYRASDLTVMSKPVVVKILNAAAGQNAWLRRKFEQEMEALARIDHPGVVGILDTGELPDGAPFLVVQYVEGITLRAALESGPLDPVRAAALLRQIGAALQAAHAQGIAHRDLKPENVMLQRLSDGTELLKLIDFGIAKVEKSHLGPNTTTVMVAGSVRYMAPEQFRGENSTASDIYALGLIACEMLTGQPDVHALRVPRKPREQIRAALAYRPQDRPERASEFCNQLAEALSATPEELLHAWRGSLSRPERRIGVAKGDKRRLDWSQKLILPGVLLLLVALASALGYYYWRPPEKPLSFQKQDLILITSFENRTGEPIFDGTLEYALERELNNSRYVRVVTRYRIGDTLRLMRKSLDAKITRELGREISLRDRDIRALVAGTVQKTHSGYILNVDLMDPQDGAIVSSHSEEGAEQSNVLGTIRRLSRWVRESLGEIPQDADARIGRLEEVTTPSLRALQLYSQAMELGYRSLWESASTLLRKSVAEDPEFASAHILLAWALRNSGRPPGEFMPHAQRAFDLANTTDEREACFIRGSFYDLKGDPNLAVAEYEALVNLYPDHYWGTNNLARMYSRMGKEERGLAFLLRCADLRPRDFLVNASVVEMVTKRTGDLDRAAVYARRAREAITDEVLNDDRLGGYIAAIELFPACLHWIRAEMIPAADEVSRIEQLLLSRPDLARGLLGDQAGFFLLGLGRFEDARRVFENLSNPAVRYCSLSNLAFLKGDRKTLHDSLRKAVEASCQYPWLVGLLTREGFLEEARHLLTLWNGRDMPDWTNEECLRGEIAFASGDRRKAARFLEEGVAKLRSEGGRVMFLASESLSNLLEEEGDLKKAVRVLEYASPERRTVVSARDVPYWLWIRHKQLRLYRKVGRMEDARRLGTELRKLLAYADRDHPILLDLNESRSSPGSTQLRH